MRVISGKFKYKQLYAPENNLVRPTTDRIKETLFNILSSKGVSGEVTVLDLFAGSGALGIESISRGAEKVVFIDKSRDSVKLLAKNLAHVGADPESYEVYNVEFGFALKKLKGRKFDVIFADPPYAAGYESKIIELVDKYGVLAQGGVLVIEHESDNKLDASPFVSDERNCGNTTLSFLTYPEEEAHND